MRARTRRIALLCLLAAWLGIGWRQAVKPLAPGVHVASPVCEQSSSALALLADITAADAYGRTAVSQGIFDAVLRVVRGARRFIVLDYAGFGADVTSGAPQRHVAAGLTDALLEQRRAVPQLRVLFITDPANEGYGALRSPDLELLRAAGVEVVPAELDRLRDSNLAWSSLWRLAVRWWDPPAAPLGVATRRLNYKSDGRKLVIADDGREGLVAVIGSANARDSESAWSNLAARVSGGALEALLASELAVARFSGWQGASEPFLGAPGGGARSPAPCGATSAARAAGGASGTGQSRARVQLLTEGAIRAELLARLDATESGDSIDVAAFQLAERGVIESLLAAARRGVGVRLILDPNERMTSRGTSGLPNQPVASELVSRSGGAIRVRWYRTHGERFHGALVLIGDAERAWLTVGSAQLTRRALDDYDLEANAAIEVARDSALAQQALQYFDTLWANRAALGIEYTADFAAFADPAQSDYWLGRFLEGTGLSSF